MCGIFFFKMIEANLFTRQKQTHKLKKKKKTPQLSVIKGEGGE